MLWGTHVRQTALCVTFGARLRSIPLGLLDRPLGHLDSRTGPPGDPLGRQRRPRHFGILAASS